MKMHKLKTERQYCDNILYEVKSFEIRKNDENFEVGDKIIYITVVNGIEVEHKISNAIFEITYLLKEIEGLKDGYVAFTVRRY